MVRKNGRVGDDEGYDYLFKLVIVGDSAVGKSNLLTTFCHNEYDADSNATIGVEFAARSVLIEGHKVKAQIWDTAGLERYRSITKAYYRGALGALVVYDITRANTFEAAQRWLADLREDADPKVVVALVGNKSDRTHERVVSKEDGQALADREDLFFLETSALTRSNVDAAYSKVLTEIYANVTRQIFGQGDSDDGGGGTKRPRGGKPVDLHKSRRRRTVDSANSCCEMFTRMLGFLPRSKEA